MSTEIEALTEALVSSQDQMLALMALTRAMRHHVTMTEALAELTRSAARVLKVAAVGVVLDLEDRPQLTAQHPAQAFGEGLLADMPAALRQDSSELLRNGSSGGGMLALPIVVRGAVAGALVSCGTAERPLGARERKVGRAIADQAGAHIENLLLVEENVRQARMQAELDLARSVQMALLPGAAPQAPGLALWARALPAREVGGDSFDYLQTAAGDTYLIVSDVSGKGMAASLMMATLRTTIRNVLHFEPNLAPAELLTRCNDALYDDFTRVGMFATLFVGRFEQQYRLLQFANAGHSPVIYRPVDGNAQLLAAADMPLGVLPGVPFVTESVRLKQNDLLLVGTDGLPEAIDAEGALYGYDRLLQKVDCVAHLPAAELGSRLLASVSDYAGQTPQSDDQTLMVVQGVA